MNSKLSMQKMPAPERELEAKKTKRICYLALDNDLVKNRHNYAPRIKYALSKSGAWEIMPLDQKFPISMAAAKQVEYSCNKIGCRLFGEHDSNFNLRDPFLHQSRVTIEYNSLHDPALEAYFQRQPVRKTLRQAKLINDKGDAICTKRYFFDYVRYLEKRRADKIIEASTQHVSKTIRPFGSTRFRFKFRFSVCRETLATFQRIGQGKEKTVSDVR